MQRNTHQSHESYPDLGYLRNNFHLSIQIDPNLIADFIQTYLQIYHRFQMSLQHCPISDLETITRHTYSLMKLKLLFHEVSRLTILRCTSRH